MSVQTIIGLDVGGTKVAAAKFAVPDFHAIAQTEFLTHAEMSFRHVQEEMVQCINELKDDSTIAVGIGVPGLIDAVTRHIVRLPNIPGAEGIDLAAFIKKHTGLPAVIDNDANCFVLAEARLGAGRGESVVAGIVMGTGVGGGIVINGDIYHGAHGYAGEFGHMLLQPGHPPYETTDKRGEVEQFLSGIAMGKRCEQATDPKDFLSGQACSFLHPQVIREVAWLVASLTHAVDPGVIVFGGSAGKALKPKIADIQHELKQWMLPGITPPRLAFGEVEYAHRVGAALLALDKR